MVIQHNISGMNSNRQLGLTTGLQAKSSEKLSSGYKINRAADDAAGLSISEKMRRQIRGLSQASHNTQDGVSYVQVADAALSEIDDMLARMNVLCVQAANDTLTTSDREAINSEIQALKKECNRTFHTTSFNDKLIWDEKTTERIVVGHEDRPYFTWDKYGVPQSQTVSPSNKAAWPVDDKFTISATTTGMQVKWEGCDGIQYQSKEYKWPSHAEMEAGVTLGLADIMDYSSTYAAASGINPDLSFSIDQDTTIADLARVMNGMTISVGSVIGTANGTVSGDSRTTYYTGSITHLAGLVSKASIFDPDDTISPVDDSGNPNAQNRIDSGTTNAMTFKFKMARNEATTMDTGSDTFTVTATYSGSMRTGSSNTSTYDGNSVWWYLNENRQPRTTNYSIYDGSLSSALNKALNGTPGSSKNSSLVNDSPGGYILIDFKMTTDDGPQYKYSSTESDHLQNVGNFTLKVAVNNGETADQVLTRIKAIDGMDLSTTTTGEKSYGYSYVPEFNANVYAGTMRLKIQAGTENANEDVIPLVYDVLNNYTLGINDLNTLTTDSALAGIEKVKKAAAIVDEQRSVFGAYQNRMEHTVKNLDNVTENTQSSESQIRDTDMAEEMVRNSNLNILAQAGQSMMAQANQTNQGVMALLQ